MTEQEKESCYKKNCRDPPVIELRIIGEKPKLYCLYHWYKEVQNWLKAFEAVKDFEGEMSK